MIKFSDLSEILKPLEWEWTEYMYAGEFHWFAKCSFWSYSIINRGGCWYSSFSLLGYRIEVGSSINIDEAKKYCTAHYHSQFEDHIL
jgi:hypothetical protein